MIDQDRLQNEIDRLRRENKAQLKRQNSLTPVLKPSWAHKVDKLVEPLTEKQLKTQAQKNLHAEDMKQQEKETRAAKEQKEKGLFHEENNQATSGQFNEKAEKPKDIMRRLLKPQKDSGLSR